MVLLTVTAAVGYVLGGDEPKGPAKANGEFAGKIVVVQTKAGVKNATIENAGIRPLGNRSFLVGKSIADDVINQRSYFTGSEVWVPVDDIESLVVFETLNQLRRNAGQ
jgi:hypothetical protein